jgi:hypothetical protein
MPSLLAVVLAATTLVLAHSHASGAATKSAPAKGPAAAASAQIAPEFASADAMLAWIDRYHLEPTPRRLSEAVRAMVRLGLLKDPEKSGLFVGFMAGVLSEQPKDAEKQIIKMFPMPPEDQGALILAVVYSGLPDWKEIATRQLVERMPARQVLLRKHLYGKYVPLLQIPLDSGVEMLDTLWGFYLATGRTEPIVRMMAKGQEGCHAPDNRRRRQMDAGDQRVA